MINFCFLLWLFMEFNISGRLQTTNATAESLHTWQQQNILKSAILRLGKKAPDSTIALSLRLKQMAEKSCNDITMTFAVSQLSLAYKLQGNLGQSTRYFFQWKRLAEQQHDTTGLGRVYLNLGQILAQANKYDQALKYLERAKTHFLALDRPYDLSEVLYEMAICYVEKGSAVPAIKLLDKALATCPKERISQIARIYTLMGKVAKEQRDYTKARNFYGKSMSLLEGQPKWSKYKAIAYNNIGESYLLEERYDSALWYLENQWILRDTLQDPDITLSTLLLLAELTTKSDRPQNAMQWLKKGIALINKTQLSPLSSNVNKTIEFVSKVATHQSANFPLAQESLTEYMKIQQRRSEALLELQSNLIKHRLQAEILLHDAHHKADALQLSLTRRTKTLGGISAILLVLVVTSLWYAKKQRGEKQNILEDKDAFIAEQVRKYDQRILQMLIVKAEYEQMKKTLKRDFGLDDDDFGGD